MSHRISPSRAAVLAALCGAAAGCSQCDTPVLTRGNLDRVADVVVVNAPDGQSYAITSNPELQTLRLLDLTAGRFAAAPNQFSPLSIPTGPDTRQLTLGVDRKDGTPDATRLFALDGSDDVVQVIRLDDPDGNAQEQAFVEIARLATGRSPVDVAAIRDGDVVTVAVALADGAVELFTIDNDVVGDSVTIALPGSHPVAVVAHPLGESFVVGDAALPLVHVLHQDDGGAWVLEPSLDVGGPVSRLAAGIVDVGDGLAPVVVALRSDVDAIMAVRLFRPGFREERYAVLGGAALPALGLEAYVPDARPAQTDESDSDDVVTVCCRGLNESSIDAGEATAAFAAVWLSDGDLVYVNLAATTLDGEALPAGRAVVRLVDDDLAPPSPPSGVDLNTSAVLWVPGPGGDRRPTVTLTTLDNFGSPPFIPLIDIGTSLLLVWEGPLPRLRNLDGDFDVDAPGFRAAGRDLAARGARVGDVAVLSADGPPDACRLPAFRARIAGLTVDNGSTDVDLDLDATLDDALTADDATCINSPTAGGAVSLTVQAGDAFVVEDNGRFLGRLVAAGRGDGTDEVIALSGVALSFVPSSAGSPSTGSRLAVPVDAHVTTMGMNLAATPRTGLGTAALVPTGIAGGRVLIPDAGSDDKTARVLARRMVLTTGSVDQSSGLPLLLTCDEGETVIGRVETFR